MFSFILFKNGFVRSNAFVFYFFKGMPFLVALLSSFVIPEKRNILITSFSGLVLLTIGWLVGSSPSNKNALHEWVSLRVVPKNLSLISQYIKDVANYPGPDYVRSFQENKSLQKIVGHKSIDVMPVEISQVYFNNLNYNPRPVIQSYSAYNAYLDSLNREKILSNKSADFILFSVGTIDDRCAFFDESTTKLALVSKYKPETIINNQILFSKKEQPVPFSEGKKEIIYAGLGEDINIPTTKGLQFSRIIIKYNLRGKMRCLFF